MNHERWSVLKMAPISPEDEELVAFFFRAFSRFEYAMKRTSRYRRTKLSEQYALIEPNWAQLEKDLDERLNERFGNASGAVRYFQDSPPEVQVLDGLSSVRFEPRPGSLLQYVKRVRNNLFHGGKQPWDSHRDRRLVSASVDVLAASLDLNEELREAYRR